MKFVSQENSIDNINQVPLIILLIPSHIICTSTLSIQPTSVYHSQSMTLGDLCFSSLLFFIFVCFLLKKKKQTIKLLHIWLDIRSCVHVMFKHNKHQQHFAEGTQIKSTVFK